MIITVHDKSSTEFSSMGLGSISPSSCIVKEELNGLYEVELSHPYDEGGKWRRIEKENIIFASTPRGKQPFRIYQVSPDMEGVKAYGRHIFYDLSDNLCLGGSVTGTPQEILTALEGSLAYSAPFVFSSDMTATGARVDLANVNPVTALLSRDEDKYTFMNAFGGEILRDGYTVAMKVSIGEDRGVAIRYGKNLVGLEVTEDISDVITRICPVTNSGGRLPEVYIDSPYMDSYANPKIYVLTGYNYYYQMRNAAQAMLDEGCDLPKVNIKADFRELAKTEEYKDYAPLEEMYLGDVVTVANIKMGFHKKAQVISYEWDCLLERYDQVELGDFVADLTSSVTEGEKSYTAAAGAATETKQLYSLISGRATINNDGLYICVDGTGIEDAAKLFHFGAAGLRYSSTGKDGTWTTIIDSGGNIV